MSLFFTRCLFICILLYICWSIQSIDGKGGRGGGGGRSSGGRSSGSRFSSRGSSGSSYRSSSSSSRYSSSSYYSRGYYASRYSYGWKTRAYSHHYVYVGHYNSWHYTRRDRTDDWNICFNLVFSGTNNTPILDVSSHERLRDLSDQEFDLAIDHVLNVSLHLATSLNSSDPMEDLMPTNENEFTKPWQYVGLFVCPMFQADSSSKYCCGSDEFQYCCTYWESARQFPYESIIYSIIAIAIIGGFAYSFIKKRQRRLLRLREIEMQAAANAAANDAAAAGMVVNGPGQVGEGYNQPLLGPYDADNRAVGFQPMQDEGMKSQESGFGMPTNWPPPSGGNVLPQYPTMAPPEGGNVYPSYPTMAPPPGGNVYPPYPTMAPPPGGNVYPPYSTMPPPSETGEHPSYPTMPPPPTYDFANQPRA